MLSQALLGPLVDVLTIIVNLGGLEWEDFASVNPYEASSSERTGVSLSSLLRRMGWGGWMEEGATLIQILTSLRLGTIGLLDRSPGQIPG